YRHHGSVCYDLNRLDSSRSPRRPWPDAENRAIAPPPRRRSGRVRGSRPLGADAPGPRAGVSRSGPSPHRPGRDGGGRERAARGDLDGAIEAFRRVLVGDPHHQDARYNLALMLRLAQRDAEATPEFLAAAQAGHARAQYFTGTAYAAGLGVERDLTTAITWWF